MSELTQKEKDALAKFAELTIETFPEMEYDGGVDPNPWYMKGDKKVCQHWLWSPATNPGHGDMVLKKLMEKYDMRILSTIEIGVVVYVIYPGGRQAARSSGENYGNVVCRAALELPEVKKIMEDLK